MTIAERRKRIALRRERNVILAKHDAAQRCSHCRTVIEGTTVEVFGTPGRFCGQDCLDAATEVARQLREAGR